MFRFLGQFSSSFLLAVMLWPVAAWVLTLPILLVQYIRYHRIEHKHVAAIYLGILYVLGLAAFTLYPMPDNPTQFCATRHLTPQLNLLQFIADIRNGGTQALLQIGMNVVFFVPLGIFLRNVFARRLAVTLVIALLTSFLVETAQLTGAFGWYPCSYRLFDVDDLVFNTLGAAIGFWLGAVLPRLPQPGVRFGVNEHPGLMQRLVTFIADLFLTYLISTLIVVPFYVFGGRDGFWQTIHLPITVVVYFILQLLVPLRLHGRTIAAKFTGITLDDRARTPVWQFVFYLTRALLLGTIVFTEITGRVGMSIGLITLVWYFAAHRQMPYSIVDKIFEGRRKAAALRR